MLFPQSDLTCCYGAILSYILDTHTVLPYDVAAGQQTKGKPVSKESRGNISPFSCVGSRARLQAYAFQSRRTTAAMISAAISLICENSLAVLTTAKPPPPIIPVQFYSPVYGTVPCCDQAQTTCFKPEADDVPQQKWLSSVWLKSWQIELGAKNQLLLL